MTSRAPKAVIANRTASRYRADPTLLGRVERATASSGARFYVTAAMTELEEAAREIASERIGHVCLSGGDGSFMAGVTALWRAFGEGGAELPALSLVPGGTAATVARNIGDVGDPADCIARLLGGAPIRTTLRPSLSVTAEQDGEVAHRVGFIFGTGLVARFFDEYYAAGAGGHATAARIVARVFAESLVGGPYAAQILTPMPCEIWVDGEKLQRDAFSLVCCSVVRDLGLHMLVNHRAPLSAESFSRVHLVASPLAPGRLGPRVGRVLRGVPIGGPGHFDDLVQRFELRFPGGEGPFVLDGDMLRAASATVTSGPRLRVVTVA